MSKYKKGKKHELTEKQTPRVTDVEPELNSLVSGDVLEDTEERESITLREATLVENSEPQKTVIEQKKETPSLSVPIAIIIAGILVAGSILYTGSKTESVPKDENYTAVASQLKKGTISAEVSLNKKAFAECIESGKYTSAIQDSIDEGIKAGVNGTPFPVIITKSGTKFMFNGKISMNELVDSALAGKTNGAVDIDIPPVSEKDHILGNLNADVFIVEYSDTECPYSKMFHQTMIDLMKGYEKEGRVAWVYRHFPLDMHPKAKKEAEATECSMELGGQSKFWEYLDLMFKVAPSNNKLDLTLL